MEALLLLGGSMGDPLATLGRAEAMLAERAGRVLARSRDHWTEPHGFTDDRLFLNRALLLDTEREPHDLLRGCLAIEQELGRTRGHTTRYAARTLDIDILLIEDQVLDGPGLSVPHPRLHERAFALAPAADVAPLLEHPRLHRTLIDLLNDIRQRALPA